MANQWTIDPNNPDQYIYKDESGTVHTAPVYQTGAKVERDASGNPTDITFPDYKEPTPAAAKRRSWGERFSDSWDEAGQQGTIGVLSRNGLYYSGYGKNEVSKMFPGLSADELDKKRWELINSTQKRMRDEAAARRAADPTWKPDRTFVQQVLSGDWIPDLLGGVVGGFGPENAVAPGSTAVARTLGQGVIGGVANSAAQGADINDGVADEFDIKQAGMDALTSMVGQGGLELIGKLAKGKAPQTDEELANIEKGLEAGQAPKAPAQTVIPVETRANIEKMIADGASVDDIAKAHPEAMVGQNAASLDWYVKNKGKWQSIRWTGDETPNTPDAPAAEAPVDEIVVTAPPKGPSGERVDVDPVIDEDFDGGKFREYTARDEEGNVLHSGRIYDDGQVLGQRPDGSPVNDPATADFVRLNAKNSETLDNLAEGTPVDPTQPQGIRPETDPELAAQFDAEIPKPSRREQIKAATAEIETQTGPGLKSVRPFPEDEPDYHRFRFVTDDGKVVDGTYTFENGHIDNLSIGDTKNPVDLGPKQLRKLIDELRGVHPDVNKVSAYRMTGARAKAGKGPEFMEVNLKGQKTPAAETPEPVEAPKTPEPEPEAPTTPVEEAPTLSAKIEAADTPDPNAPPPEDVVNRLTSALASAGKATDEQLAKNAETRKERFREVGKARARTSGEAGLAAEMSALKGEFPKVSREAVRDKFEQAEVDAVFDWIKNNKDLSWGESVRARLALYKLLDGHPIQSAEIALLGRIMPKDFVKATLKHRTMKTKIGDIIGNTLNLPRSLMSSFDLSAPLRQAWFFTTRKEFYGALPGMFKQAFSEKTFSDVMGEIRSRPTYEAMEASGLSLSDLSHDLNMREEAFMSNYAEKIPGIGKIVRGSERGFTGFLNKVRADVFDDLVRKAKAAGRDIDDPDFLKDLSGFINNATGRGSLGSFSQAGQFLNAIFFSPRLISSRLALLNPAYYATLDPFVRKEALKSLFGSAAFTTSVLSLAQMGGLDVEADPRSTDFGKIRDGDTRYDVMGGFGQYITLFSRLATNETKSAKEDIKELGEGFGQPTRLDVLGRFATGKASPIAAFIASYFRGKDPIGEPFEPGEGIKKAVTGETKTNAETINEVLKDPTVQLFTPLFLQDAQEVLQEEGPNGLPKLVPSFFGVGVSTYNNAPSFDRLGQANDKQGGKMPNGFFTGDETVKPVIDEIARLETKTGKDLFAPVKKSDVKDFAMTDDQFYQYEYYAGAYIREDLKAVMQSPEWKAATDEEKVKIAKKVVKDQKANARDLLFPKQ